MGFRLEKDSLGEVAVSEDRYWGAQTERARQNFAISSLRIPPLALDGLAAVKLAAARANRDLGLLDPTLASAIERAASEVREGRFPEDFPLDVFQTGSGTSWNMNMNEVIASRANELLGAGRGGRSPVHPNDHVNLGQSSNDVIPAVLHLANRLAGANLVDALQGLSESLERKARTFADVVKLGRTHLQDAVPMTLGQELSGWAAQFRRAAAAVRASLEGLTELPLGGTAVGTGLNAHPHFGERVCAELAELYAVPFRVATNPFELISSRDVQVGLFGAVAQAATALMKVAGDLRLLASGPRGGIGELLLPTLQPGSSIMPGKVNPVIPEMAIQAGTYVLGVQTMVAVANQFATLQLNLCLPLLIHQTVSALEVLANATRAMDELCIQGLDVDREVCRRHVERSLALVTPLARSLGYDEAARIARTAVEEGKTIREVCLEQRVLPEEELNRLLDPMAMVGPLRLP